MKVTFLSFFFWLLTRVIRGNSRSFSCCCSPFFSQKQERTFSRERSREKISNFPEEIDAKMATVSLSRLTNMAAVKSFQSSPNLQDIHLIWARTLLLFLVLCYSEKAVHQIKDSMSSSVSNNGWVYEFLALSVHNKFILFDCSVNLKLSLSYFVWSALQAPRLPEPSSEQCQCFDSLSMLKM